VGDTTFQQLQPKPFPSLDFSFDLYVSANAGFTFNMLKISSRLFLLALIAMAGPASAHTTTAPTCTSASDCPVGESCFADEDYNGGTAECMSYTECDSACAWRLDECITNSDGTYRCSDFFAEQLAEIEKANECTSASDCPVNGESCFHHSNRTWTDKVTSECMTYSECESTCASVLDDCKTISAGIYQGDTDLGGIYLCNDSPFNKAIEEALATNTAPAQTRQTTVALTKSCTSATDCPGDSSSNSNGDDDNDDLKDFVSTASIVWFVFMCVILVLSVMVVYKCIAKCRQRRLSLQAFDFKAQLQELRASGEIPAAEAEGDSAVSRRQTLSSYTAGIPREIKRRHIARSEKIGSGAFGEVYKGVLDESQMNGIPGYMVACKSATRSSGEGADGLKFEATVMAQVGAHTHLVSLIGVVTTSAPLLLVVSYCEHGSLLAVLRKHAGNGLPLATESKLQHALESAKGMEYLCSQRYIHRDLAARNVLVASGMVAKVADFGLSRSAARGGSDSIENEPSEDYYRSTTGVFAVRWTAPEAMEEHRFTQASDVWSFGILLVEIFQDGVVPYGLWSTARVIAKVLGGSKHMQPTGCQDAVYAMMLQCWATDGQARPLFSHLVTMLENICESLQREIGCSGQGVLDVSPSCTPSASVPANANANRDTGEFGYEMPEGYCAKSATAGPLSQRAPQQMVAHVDDHSSLQPSIALDQNGYVADTTGLELHQQHPFGGCVHEVELKSLSGSQQRELNSVPHALHNADTVSSLQPSNAALEHAYYFASSSMQTDTVATTLDTLLPSGVPIAILSSPIASWEGSVDFDTIVDAVDDGAC
jgi:serine/threonine protein kinase